MHSLRCLRGAFKGYAGGMLDRIPMWAAVTGVIVLCAVIAVIPFLLLRVQADEPVKINAGRGRYPLLDAQVS